MGLLDLIVIMTSALPIVTQAFPWFRAIPDFAVVEDNIQVQTLDQDGRHRIGRSARETDMPDNLHFRFRLNGTDVNIRVKRSDVFAPNKDTKRAVPDFPVFVIEDGHIKRKQIIKPQGLGFYTNESTGSSFVVRRKSSRTEFIMEGIFYQGLQQLHLSPGLKGSSHRVHKQGTVVDFSEDYVDSTGKSYGKSSPHAKVHDKISPSRPATNQRKAPAKSDSQPRRPSVQKRQAGDEHEVQLFMVADYRDYRTWLKYYGFNSTLTELEMNLYYAFIANSMSVRYSSVVLVDPSFRLDIIISGLLIVNSQSVSYWTEDYTLRPGSHFVDASSALDSFRHWVKSARFDLPNSDHWMLFTGFDIYTDRNPNVAGLAKLGGMCSLSSVSIIEQDNTGSVGATAAHELGHSLGALHDGEEKTCYDEDNYIMSRKLKTPDDEHHASRPWQFSPCSVQAFKRFVSQTKCTHRSSIGMSVLSTELSPGQVFSADLQCQLALGNGSYFGRSLQIREGYPSMCRRLYCAVPGEPGLYQAIFAMEKTSCGDGKWCQQGKCVDHMEAPHMEDMCPQGDDPTAPCVREDCPYYTVRTKTVYCCSTCHNVMTSWLGLFAGRVSQSQSQGHDRQIEAVPVATSPADSATTSATTIVSVPRTTTSPIPSSQGSHLFLLTTAPNTTTHPQVSPFTTANNSNEVQNISPWGTSGLSKTTSTTIDNDVSPTTNSFRQYVTSLNMSTSSSPNIVHASSTDTVSLHQRTSESPPTHPVNIPLTTKGPKTGLINDNFATQRTKDVPATHQIPQSISTSLNYDMISETLTTFSATSSSHPQGIDVTTRSIKSMATKLDTPSFSPTLSTSAQSGTVTPRTRTSSITSKPFKIPSSSTRILIEVQNGTVRDTTIQTPYFKEEANLTSATFDIPTLTDETEPKNAIISHRLGDDVPSHAQRPDHTSTNSLKYEKGAATAITNMRVRQHFLEKPRDILSQRIILSAEPTATSNQNFSSSLPSLFRTDTEPIPPGLMPSSSVAPSTSFLSSLKSSISPTFSSKESQQQSFTTFVDSSTPTFPLPLITPTSENSYTNNLTERNQSLPKAVMSDISFNGLKNKDNFDNTVGINSKMDPISNNRSVMLFEKQGIGITESSNVKSEKMDMGMSTVSYIMKESHERNYSNLLIGNSITAKDSENITSTIATRTSAPKFRTATTFSSTNAVPTSRMSESELQETAVNPLALLPKPIQPFLQSTQSTTQEIISSASGLPTVKSVTPETPVNTGSMPSIGRTSMNLKNTKENQLPVANEFDVLYHSASRQDGLSQANNLRIPDKDTLTSNDLYRLGIILDYGVDPSDLLPFINTLEGNNGNSEAVMQNDASLYNMLHPVYNKETQTITPVYSNVLQIEPELDEEIVQPQRSSIPDTPHRDRKIARSQRPSQRMRSDSTFDDSVSKKTRGVILRNSGQRQEAIKTNRSPLSMDSHKIALSDLAQNSHRNRAPLLSELTRLSLGPQQLFTLGTPDSHRFGILFDTTRQRERLALSRLSSSLNGAASIPRLARQLYGMNDGVNSPHRVDPRFARERGWSKLDTDLDERHRWRLRDKSPVSRMPGQDRGGVILNHEKKSDNFIPVNVNDGRIRETQLAFQNGTTNDIRNVSGIFNGEESRNHSRTTDVDWGKGSYTSSIIGVNNTMTPNAEANWRNLFKNQTQLVKNELTVPRLFPSTSPPSLGGQSSSPSPSLPVNKMSKCRFGCVYYREPVEPSRQEILLDNLRRLLIPEGVLQSMGLRRRAMDEFIRQRAGTI